MAHYVLVVRTGEKKEHSRHEFYYNHPGPFQIFSYFIFLRLHSLKYIIVTILYQNYIDRCWVYGEQCLYGYTVTNY